MSVRSALLSGVFPFFKRAPGYVVYLDESGSFELRIGRTDAIALAVVPRRALLSVTRFVRRLEARTDPSERRGDEVKGSHLRPERFRGIIRFVRRHGIKLSPFIGRVAVQSEKKRGLKDEAAHLRSLVRGTSREEEGHAIAEGMAQLGAEDRYYCRFAYQVIKDGLVRDLVRRGRWPIEVVYDPKLHDPFDRVLRFAINSAFTELHIENVPSPVDALLGDPAMPWSVRPAGSDDREGVALADWLVYPLAVALREGATSERRAAYAAICDRYDRAGIVVHSDSQHDVDPGSHG